MYTPYKLQFSEQFCTDLYHTKLHESRLEETNLILKCRKYVGKIPTIQLTIKPLDDSVSKDSVVTIKCTLFNTLFQLKKCIENPSDYDSSIDVILYALSDFKNGTITFSYAFPCKESDQIECVFSEPFTYTLKKASVMESIVSLNLHLAKWRFAPDMDLDALKKQTVLILGVGSLGCHVIRTLLAYGVRKYILVDNGVVSHSTVIRQLFYERQHLSMKKCDVAKQKINSIVESAEVSAYDFTIPIFETRDYIEDTVRRIRLLNDLVKQCDALFLLTDNRESRWLPTVLGKMHGKRTFTCAIGFDTFVCMEHSEETGCYFCNDVVAPRNGAEYLTEDQRCTVSLPGMSGISAGIITEIYATPFVDPNEQPRSMHIRALRGLNIVRMNTHRNEICVACGDKVDLKDENGDLDAFTVTHILQKPYLLESTSDDVREVWSDDE